jgi:chemotaxis signal transduction protein
VGKYLTFRIAGREFAMDATRVRGILPIHELGGRDFPVIDLRSKLGLTKASGGRMPCIVVVEVGANDETRLVGFVADRVSDVVQLRKRDLRNGMTRGKGRPRRVLDPDVILRAP